MSDLTRIPAPDEAAPAAGAAFDDIVELTFLVADMAHVPTVRAGRDARIPADRPPAASAVQVAAPVRPEFPMEIEAYAVVGA